MKQHKVTVEERVMDLQNEVASVKAMLKDFGKWVNKIDKELHPDPIYLQE